MPNLAKAISGEKKIKQKQGNIPNFFNVLSIDKFITNYICK